MFPGGMNPKKMQQMMRQLGIEVTDVDNVERVVITTATKEIVFERPSVTVMKAQGTTTYSVVGDPKERAKQGGPAVAGPAAPAMPARAEAFSEADVKLVAEQARVSPSKARQALAECDGKPAEAILKLIGE
ncbi:MAG: nascent polypeptide-associated complex protein [Methanobacteriota archaeon]